MIICCTRKIRDIVAKLGIEYDHCSTQINLPADLAEKVIYWGNRNVPENILHNDGRDSKGRENDIHCTLLYGLKDINPSAVQNLVGEVPQFKIRMGLITSFMDKPAYDVLKIDAEAPELLKLHYLIRNNFENDNKFPTYAPHITVAYVKKGEALKYLGDDTFRNMEFNVPEITFSGRDGKKTQIKLKS